MEVSQTAWVSFKLRSGLRMSKLLKKMRATDAGLGRTMANHEQANERCFSLAVQHREGVCISIITAYYVAKCNARLVVIVAQLNPHIPLLPPFRVVPSKSKNGIPRFIPGSPKSKALGSSVP